MINETLGFAAILETFSFLVLAYFTFLFPTNISAKDYYFLVLFLFFCCI